MRRPVTQAAAVAASLLLFAVFAHRPFPANLAAAAALLAATIIIGNALREGAWPPAWLRRGRFILMFAAVGIAAGVLTGLLQRQRPGALSGVAGGLQAFVLVACLIGVAEELVYRGWMLDRLAAINGPIAIALAALAHAAYKTALFAWPPASIPVSYDLRAIALWTLLGGMVLGALRVASRSVWPAVLGHATFDAVAYAGFATAPWWVWG